MSTIFGADIDRDVLFEEERIQTFYCDQLNPVAIQEMWDQPQLQEHMDIIIDDGLHTFAGNMSFLSQSLDHLCPGGYYIVEDIMTSVIPAWREALTTSYIPKWPNHEFTLARLPNMFNYFDNSILIIHNKV